MAPIARVKGRFAHQAVHPGFGAQPAEGILAFKMDSGAFNARHIAGGHFDQGGFKIVGFTPAQVHAQQYLSPILGFGTAGTGLDIQIGTIDIHLTAEHTAKLHLFQQGHQAGDFLFDFRYGFFVILSGSQFQQIAGIDGTDVQLLNSVNPTLQSRSFASQFLGAVGIVPDAGFCQL